MIYALGRVNRLDHSIFCVSGFLEPPAATRHIRELISRYQSEEPIAGEGAEFVAALLREDEVVDSEQARINAGEGNAVYAGAVVDECV